MRKLLVAIAILVAVVVGGALLAAANLDSWLNANRDWVGGEIERVVGRKVRFGELSVSIWSGFGVRVTDVAIGDDPAFSDGDFVSAGVVDVRVKLLPALTGEIQVGRVVLREPSIRVIRTAAGLSVDSLGAKRPARKPGEPSPAEKAPSDGAGQAVALTVSLIDVRGGRFAFVDRTEKPPSELALTQFDFSASDVSLTEPIRFALRAAAFGAGEQNIEISGTVGPVSAGANLELDVDLAIGPLSVDELLALPPAKGALPPGMTAGGALRLEARAKGRLDALTVDGSFDATDAVIARSDAASGGFEKPDGKPLRFDWAAVRRGDALDVSKADVRLGESIVHVEAKLANLATEPGGTFALRSERIAFSELGMPTREGARGDEIRDLAIDGRIAIPSSGPKLTIGLVSPSGVAGGAEYDDLRVDFEFARQRATISSLRIGAFDGEVRANGYYDLGAQDRPSFDLVTALEKVSVPKLVESQAPSLVGRVEGVLAANLSVRGSGSAWEEIRQQMVGGGNLVMEDGTLKDVNVADAVLKGVTGVAGLSQLISPQIRGKYPSLFGVGDTVFEKLDAKLDIRDGIARIQDFRLAARDYSLSGEGRYELRNALDMRVAMTLSEALTGDLVDSVKQARYLENSGGRIEIPARLRGGIPNVKAEPDLSGVASTLQAELVGGLLKGALGEKKEGDAGESEGEELLRRGLNSLLGGGKK